MENMCLPQNETAPAPNMPWSVHFFYIIIIIEYQKTLPNNEFDITLPPKPCISKTATLQEQNFLRQNKKTLEHLKQTN